MTGDLADLPEWVWDLIEALDRFEEEHPILYRMDTAAEYERTDCISPYISGIIPREVRDAAAVYQAGRAREVAP